MSGAAIERAVEILEGGRLHRYNTLDGEVSEASLLEQEYANYHSLKLHRSPTNTL